MTQPPIIEVQLVHIEGPLKGEIQEITAHSIAFGRDPSSQVCFPADLTLVSRRHAEIVREGNRFKLVDCSTNGTLLNGNRVEQAYLKDGDVITLAPGGPKISFLTQVIEARPDPFAVKQQDIPGPHSQPGHMPLPDELSKSGHVGHPDFFPPPKPYKVPGDDLAGPSVQVPLVIQYGPTLQNYRTLPITLGSSPGCDFVLLHSSIADRHAEFSFAKGQYWVRDLTGKDQVLVNDKPVASQSPLKPNDTLRLAPQGPVFCFLGEGRLAEVEGQASHSLNHSGVKKGRGTRGSGTARAKSRTVFWFLTLSIACLVLGLSGFVLYHTAVKKEGPSPWDSAGKRLENIWTATKDRFGSLAATITGDPDHAKSPVGEAVLKVESRPAGAQVFLDGNLKGKAPLNLRLPLGKYEIRLTYTGHYEWEAEIELNQGGETPLFARLVPLDNSSEYGNSKALR